MTDVYEVNRPAAILHTIVAVITVARLFQHIYEDFMQCCILRKLPSLSLSIKLAIPVVTGVMLFWSGWRRITPLQRVIVSVVLVLLGLSSFALAYGASEQQLGYAMGVSLVALGVGLLAGDVLGVPWLVHPWSVRRSSSVMPDGSSFTDVSSCSDAMTQSFDEEEV